MKPFLTALFSLFLVHAGAQTAFRFGDAPPVQILDHTLSMPFAGGINSAQIQQMDANGDGLDDLVIWDKNTNNLLIFENNGDGYTHRPMLSYYFPADINGFIALVDYDQDGKKDLFTSSPFGIKVYQNITRPGAQFPEWEVAQDYLRLDNNSNVQANNLDIPAFIDVDGDGDIDIVTFNFASGDYLEYYQNTSMERKGAPDVDGFASAETRWGGFEFCECNVFSFGMTCSGNPISNSNQISERENSRITHAGGHSILMHDFNGDGVLDILMGQDECNRLYYLPNEGTNSAPIFNRFFLELPGLGALPEFPIFHASYLLGENLVISTNSSHVAAQFDADYSKSLYHYQNGTLTTTAFLQEDMLDLGENARPFFKGNGAAGELIVTANGLHEGKVVGKAYRFNWTTAGVTLEDDDYLQLSSLDWIDLQYQEYIASNHRSHTFISGVEIINFAPVRKLLWDNQNEGGGMQEIQIPGVQLSWNDQFEFYRYRGEDYLLLARQSGELIRFKVNLGDIPTVTLLDRDYLGFTDNPATRNLVVHVVETDMEPVSLFTMDRRGKLAHIPDIEHPSQSSTQLLQATDDQTIETRFGRNTWIASIPDAFGSQTDLILGTGAGGLLYLEAVSSGSPPSGQEEPQINIYPNPSHGPLRMITSVPGVISLFNPLGQIIWEDISVQANTPLDLDMRALSAGIYFVRFVSDAGKIVTKKIIRSGE